LAIGNWQLAVGLLAAELPERSAISSLHAAVAIGTQQSAFSNQHSAIDMWVGIGSRSLAG